MLATGLARSITSTVEESFGVANENIVDALWNLMILNLLMWQPASSSTPLLPTPGFLHNQVNRPCEHRCSWMTCVHGTNLVER